MSGFSSLDDLINQITTNAKFYRADWNKLTFGVTAQTAGLWYCLSAGGGNPNASAFLSASTGTNLTMQSIGYDSLGGGGIYHGGHVSAADGGFKHILNASAFSAGGATAVPAVLMLVDLLAYHPITTITSTASQALISSVAVVASNGSPDILLTYAGYDMPSYSKVQFTTTTTLPTGLALATDYWLMKQSGTTAKVATTYENAENGVFIDFTNAGTGTHTATVQLPRYSDGKGVQTFLTPSVVMGAGTPTITMTYTNKDGVASKTTPTTPALPLANATAPVSQIVHSGTGAGKYGPFMPLAAGDGGVRKATAIQLSATMTSGVLNLVYCKPLLTLPITTLGVAAERDCVNQIASMPKVYDGAHLCWLMYAGGATAVAMPYYGHIDFGWS